MHRWTGQPCYGCTDEGTYTCRGNLFGRKSRKETHVVEKLDLQLMNWFNWTTETEEQIAKGVEEPKNEVQCHKLWDKFRMIIDTSTTQNCQTKRISPLSKSYSTAELSAISRKMRKALESHLTRNTDNNLEDNRRWKEVFENTTKKALEDHFGYKQSYWITLERPERITLRKCRKWTRNVRNVFRSKTHKAEPERLRQGLLH